MQPSSGARRLRGARLSATPGAEQMTLAAERLSTVRCRELLAACCVELVKAALVGSGGGGGDPSADPPSPEALLDALHTSLQASLQDAAGQIAPTHQEAWAEGQWEAFMEAQGAVQALLLALHRQAAAAGSRDGALQVRAGPAACHPQAPACLSLALLLLVGLLLLATALIPVARPPGPSVCPAAGCALPGAWPAGAARCGRRLCCIPRGGAAGQRRGVAALRYPLLRGDSARGCVRACAAGRGD